MSEASERILKRFKTEKPETVVKEARALPPRYRIAKALDSIDDAMGEVPMTGEEIRAVDALRSQIAELTGRIIDAAEAPQTDK